MYFCYIWKLYSTGIPKIELTNVELQEQTASLHVYYVLREDAHLISAYFSSQKTKRGGGG